jgi:tetraacyldisaccharide 4'-kinase
MLKLFLYPLSAIYGIIVYLRNKMYDLKILRSVEFDLPIISVGNITVGGTGKTPFTEYLVGLLKDRFKVATLSRGYKRKTSGFRLAEISSTVSMVGDEPLQIKNKFPEIKVAVCEKRVEGVKHLLNIEPGNPPDVILLDDAFQHRKILPGISILLVDYNRPIGKDKLLPVGRLREGSIQIRRANIIIVTKCPQELTPITRRILQKNVFLKPYQSLYFTSFKYGSLTPAFENEKIILGDDLTILLVTGIASTIDLKAHLQRITKKVEEIRYGDHYPFNEKDVEKIMGKFNSIEASKKIIVTTEKDFIRFREINDLNKEFSRNLYYLPVKIDFLEDGGEKFNQKIVNYVGENKSNLSLHKRKGKPGT